MNKAWRAVAFVSLLACFMGTVDTDMASAQDYPKASRKKPRQTVAAPAAQSVTQDTTNAAERSSGYVSEEELERMRQSQAANEAYKKDTLKYEQIDAENERQQDKLRREFLDIDMTYLDNRIKACRETLPRLRENVAGLESSLNDGSIRKLQREELVEVQKVLEEYNNTKMSYASQPDVQAKFIAKYRTLADLRCKYAEVYEQVLDKRGITGYTKARSLLKF